MAYEVKDWKAPGCSLTLKTDKLSDRETSSSEINKEYGEGGGLNANYRTVEALAIVANLLGAEGLKYGQDFVFKTSGLDEIILDFADKDTLGRADMFIFDYLFRKTNHRKVQVTKKPAIKCLLCGGEMKLESYDESSYFQCQQDDTHRLSLSEWSDLQQSNSNKEKITEAMRQRQKTLQAQLT